MTACPKARAGFCAAAPPLTAFFLPALAVVAMGVAPLSAQVVKPGEAVTQPAGAKSDQAATRQYATAAALQNREQYELAIDEWQKYLDGYPRDANVEKARHYLGVCYLQTRQYPQALAAFQKFLADYPKSTLDEPSRLYLGLAQYNLARAGQADQYPKAAATFELLATKHPRGKHLAQAIFYQGESLYAQGKKAEAARLYQQLVKQFPGDALLPDALYALGVAQEELGQSAAADATYAAWLERFSSRPLAAEVNLRRGEALAAQRKFAQAEKLFAAAAGQKDFALADRALLRQAACRMERKEYPQAAALYSSLPAKFPQSQHKPAALLAAGKCEYLSGRFAEARAALAQVSGGTGDTAAEAAHWIARSFLKEHKPADALKVVDRALPGAAGNAASGAFAVQLEMDRADALIELPDQAKQAIATYAALAKGHAADPLAPQALYMAGFAALGQKEYADASRYAGEFLKQYPSHELKPDVLRVAAESQLLATRYDEAQRLYDELLASYPKHPDSPQWTLRRGLALFLQKKYAETVAAITPTLRALADKQQTAEAQYLIGASYDELKQYGSAAKALEASLAADPKWPQADETLLALAHAQGQGGDAKSAKATLQQLIKTRPESRHLDRAHYRLGELAYADGDQKSAAAEYQTVVDRWPDSSLAPHALYGLGWVQLTQADYENAVKTLGRLIDGPPLDKNAAGDLIPRARYARALARQQLKQFGPAIEDVQAFLSAATADKTSTDKTSTDRASTDRASTEKSAAERSDARYVLGLCQSGLGKAADAEATFRALLSDDPGYSGADKALYELAWVLRSQGKEDAAVEAFARLAKERADSPLAAESLFHVGEANYRKEDFARAAVAYYEAMNKAGKGELGEKAAHKLAWSYFRQASLDKAQQTFAYQRTSYPNGPLAADAAFMEAECLFKQNKYKDALAAYRQVKNPTGKDFAVLTLLHAAQAAGQMKQWDDSLKLLTQAAAEFPNSDYLPEILFEQATDQRNLGKLDQAQALYEAVTTKTDREVAARARFMVGEICFEKKDHAAAVRHFFKAAYGYAYPQWQAAAQYEAGRCFEVLGKPQQARKSYQEIVDKYAESEQASLAKKRLAELGK
jgi:TolA-binding protein